GGGARGGPKGAGLLGGFPTLALLLNVVLGSRPQADYAEGGDGPQGTLESQHAHFLALDEILEGGRHARGDEHLASLGLAAQARGQVGDRADGTVVPATLEADGPDGGVAFGYPHPHRYIVAALAPAGAEIVDPLAHGHRHAD